MCAHQHCHKKFLILHLLTPFIPIPFPFSGHACSLGYYWCQSDIGAIPAWLSPESGFMLLLQLTYCKTFWEVIDPTCWVVKNQQLSIFLFMSSIYGSVCAQSIKKMINLYLFNNLSAE